jgi:tRNA(fMet)-specific endonuclease VapC
MIIAESDVLIDALRGRSPSAERITLELGTGGLATTTISAFELWSGARTDRSARQVASLLSAMPILPLDRDAATRAAEVRRQLEAAGTPIGMADYLIAGICLARSALLLTRNRAHFDRVAGLTLGRLSHS